ncbi:DNA/RNA nuclease SfsA [Hominifimenecus sp. rT4P-3]|uniref:DNA/RNA nuclease SfsA n=1 Tax=Hominifimenecus sp. rT4P-3 TaxID=3242979 RepID=UPI003DA596B8
MQYVRTVEGIFLSRPNRFLAQVNIQGQEECCHVKNTGRLGELLLPGAPVILEEHEPGKRKTRYSLIAVWKSGQWINIDSQAPNAAAAEWLAESPLGFPITLLKREQRFEESRFDFHLEGAHGEKAFVEVKGVTLVEDGVAYFPDAPTERGVKHIQHLIRAKEAGYQAYLLFVIQRKGVLAWKPNERTHPAFAEAVRKAAQAGIKILAYDCLVRENGMAIDALVPCYF